MFMPRGAEQHDDKRNNQCVPKVVQEYANFVQCCKSMSIKFNQIIKSSYILITADEESLVELGY